MSDVIERARQAQTTDRKSLDDLRQRLNASYVTSFRDQLVADALDGLVTKALATADPSRISANIRQPGSGLIVVAPSGAGKTRLLTRAFSKNPVFNVTGNDGHGRILLTVIATKPTSLISLGYDLMGAMGYPVRGRHTAHALWRLVRERLKFLGIIFVWIDEFQHTIDHKNPRETTEIRDTLKTLLIDDRWPVSLILSGLPHIVEFIEGAHEVDVQVTRRYRFLSLTQLSLSKERDEIFSILLRAADLAKIPTDIDKSSDFIERLHHAALRRLGIIIEFVNEAAIAAVGSNSGTLTISNFAEVYAARSGSSPLANPFLVRDWHEIDCRRVLSDGPVRTDEVVVSGKKRRRNVW